MTLGLIRNRTTNVNNKNKNECCVDHSCKRFVAKYIITWKRRFFSGGSRNQGRNGAGAYVSFVHQPHRIKKERYKERNKGRKERRKWKMLHFKVKVSNQNFRLKKKININRYKETQPAVWNPLQVIKVFYKIIIDIHFKAWTWVMIIINMNKTDKT